MYNLTRVAVAIETPVGVMVHPGTVEGASLKNWGAVVVRFDHAPEQTFEFEADKLMWEHKELPS